MKQIPADDIAIQFYDGDPLRPTYGIRIASRHGNETAPRILAGIKPLLRDGVKIRCWLETPSRFASGGNFKLTAILNELEQADVAEG